jgi:glycosyltransferase involved in cell wall biosynthesis
VLGSSVWIEKKQMCYGQDLVNIIHHLQSKEGLGCNVRGVMIGDGTGIAHLKRMTEKFGLQDRVEFLGRRDATELPRLISKWHIGLSTQTNDHVGFVRTTGKLPIYLACGRFVIASRVGEAARILPSEMLVEYEGGNDTDYPSKAADRIAELIRENTFFVRREDSIQLAERFFDYNLLAQTYQAVIERFIVSQ